MEFALPRSSPRPAAAALPTKRRVDNRISTLREYPGRANSIKPKVSSRQSRGSRRAFFSSRAVAIARHQSQLKQARATRMQARCDVQISSHLQITMQGQNLRCKRKYSMRNATLRRVRRGTRTRQSKRRSSHRHQLLFQAFTYIVACATVALRGKHPAWAWAIALNATGIRVDWPGARLLLASGCGAVALLSCRDGDIL